MKLIDLIEYLKTTDRLLQFYKSHDLNLDSEEISIYMKDEISIDSELYFLEVEETDGEVAYKKGNEGFIYFFPLEHTLHLITEELDLINLGMNDSQIAKRLVDYRIKDA